MATLPDPADFRKSVRAGGGLGQLIKGKRPLPALGAERPMGKPSSGKGSEHGSARCRCFAHNLERYNSSAPSSPSTNTALPPCLFHPPPSRLKPGEDGLRGGFQHGRPGLTAAAERFQEAEPPSLRFASHFERRMTYDARWQEAQEIRPERRDLHPYYKRNQRRVQGRLRPFDLTQMAA